MGITGWGTRCCSTGELFIMEIAQYAEKTTPVCPSPHPGEEGPGSTTIALCVGIVQYLRVSLPARSPGRTLVGAGICLMFFGSVYFNTDSYNFTLQN